LPFRLLREMASFPCQGRDDLYNGIRHALNWERWLHPSMSFRVDVTGSAPGLNHSHYSALQVKNALVDQQRDIWGTTLLHRFGSTLIFPCTSISTAKQQC
jgi:putative N6-adenine-specific DNA methylase